MKDVIETVPPMALTAEEIPTLLQELSSYHAIYSPLFQRREQRMWSAQYLRGLLMNIPRKSIEPMVRAMQGAEVRAVRAMQQFLSEGAWDDEAILYRHWQEVDTTLGDADGVLIVDGSNFPKQGQHSVGVKRQSCGNNGRRANCQAGVFIGYASPHGYTLLDRRLYLPREWVEDAAYAERRRCGVPEGVLFQAKPELALAMIQAVVATGRLRCRWMTCDDAFGQDPELLDNVAKVGLWYFAEIPHDTRVWRAQPVITVPAGSCHGRKPRRKCIAPGEPAAQTVAILAATLPTTLWVRQAIKEGSQGPLVGDFVALRVVSVRDGLPGPEVWLVLRRHPTTGELKAYLSNAPADTPLSTLVRLSGLRWPIERCFEEGKQLLGMGDYEVRTWRGWHHHMTLCILAHHFLVRMQQRFEKSGRTDYAIGPTAVDRRPAVSD